MTDVTLDDVTLADITFTDISRESWMLMFQSMQYHIAFSFFLMEETDIATS